MENETYGDAVEHNRAMHEEALRRARERNDGGAAFGYPNQQTPGAEDGTFVTPHSKVWPRDEEAAPVSGVEPDVIPTADTAGPLNWASGSYLESPAYVPSAHLPGPGEPITSAPRVDTGLSGVDAIVGFMEGGR